MIQYPEIVDLARALWAFYEPIRYRRGFDQSAFDEVCNAIRTCTQRWGDAEEVPRVVAWLLANYAYTIAVNKDVAAWYADDEAERIRRATSTISDLIGDCFKPAQDVIENEYLVILGLKDATS
jgi:hypothetical protein